MRTDWYTNTLEDAGRFERAYAERYEDAPTLADELYEGMDLVPLGADQGSDPWGLVTAP